MSIFEYDEERELNLIQRAEYEEERIATLKNLVARKLVKGWSPAQMAEDLEMELSEVEKLSKEIHRQPEAVTVAQLLCWGSLKI